MRIKVKKIIYFISKWYEGTSYKNIVFMQDNFGGEIIKDDIHGVIKSIEKKKPDLMVVRGDAKIDYKIPMNRNIPYILIENDVNSLRRGSNKHAEMQDREKIENASAVIFTSEEHAEYYEKMKKKYGWKMPYYEVIYTRPLKKDLDFDPIEKLEGLNLVYAGGVIANWNKADSIYGYRCYHKIFGKFIEAGWKVHIYSASYNNNKLREYRELGCITYNNMPYKKLLQEMSRYTAGLHSYNKINVSNITYDYTQTCRPNKLWDYLAAGIPTIGYQGGNGMKIYDGKWGIVIDDLEMETLNKIPERLKKLRITKRMRYGNVMDKDIEVFRRVIKEALEEAKNRKKKRYHVSKSLYKIKDSTRFPNRIKVHNKGVISIYRGGYIFPPGETSRELIVNMRTYKEIKAHVSLKIEYVE